MKVLIVDDSKAMRTFLGYLARKLEFETVEAVDGCQALEVLAAQPMVKLALVDWDMPRMNGLDFVKALRAKPAYDSLKIMMVTTQNSMDRVAAALNAGATDYLMKPVSEGSLHDKFRVLGVMP